VAVHQRSLFAVGIAGVNPDAVCERRELGDGTWIDVRRNWLGGTDLILDHLIETVEWRRGRRHMFDRMVDDPRLSRWYRRGDALPHPSLVEVASSLAHEYRVKLSTAGLNYYRDGADSVAFHADRELRALDDTLVAIVTFGARRAFLVRPKGGGRSIDLSPAGGDLIVMGGTCQRNFEHSVPKARAAGPRISATWRWAADPAP
jgi:alkylated DNA repair dioxygenase AlkB